MGWPSQFGERYVCPAPRTVLVRIRAEFATPVSAGRRSQAHVRAGYVAVRTEADRPMACGDVFDTGRARIFTARSCVDKS
jgi:hypothetical protein